MQLVVSYGYIIIITRYHRSIRKVHCHESSYVLAVSGQGLARAERDQNSNWSVEHLLTDQDPACLVLDPQQPHIIYAGTKENGVLRSADQGRSWQSMGLSGQAIKSIAVSPHDSQIIYAGTKPALMFISRDGGDTWAELDGFRHIPNRWWWFSPAELLDRRPYVFAIAPSPTEPDVILAGVEFGAVVRSENGGQTWSRRRRGALRDCHSLKFHTRNGDWVYEAGGTGGAGWQPIGWEAHPLSVVPTALVTLPDDPGHLYAGLSNGDVWHSPDYGDSWEQMPFNLTGIWFSMLVL